jgi:hypothetical protein
MKRLAMLFFVLAPATASGQSTSGLGRVEPSTSYQLTVGASSQLILHGYAGQIGPSRAVNVGVVRELSGPMNLRFDGWVSRRTASSGRGYLPYGGHYDDATGTWYTETLRSSWLVAVVASGTLPIRIGRDVVLSPSIGVGVVPAARGRFTEVAQPVGAEPAPTGKAITRSSQGIAWATGASLRWRHLVVEQHILQITGADGALLNGENAPLMIGWRF